MFAFYAETPLSTMASTSIITDATTQSGFENETNMTGGVMPSPTQAGKTSVITAVISVVLGLVMYLSN